MDATPDIVAERDRLLKVIVAFGAVSSCPGGTPSLMRETVNQVQHLTHADGAVVELVDGEELIYEAASGTVAPYVGLRLPADRSLSGLCVLRGEVIYSHDTELDPRVNAEACRKVNARSMLVVPLRRGDEPIGVLKCVSRSPAAFDRVDEHTLALFAQFIGGVIARQADSDRSTELAAAMERRALCDDLTGLPNRAAWHEELRRGIERARRAQLPLAVMYLDLNNFKAINDGHGHAAGDHVLVNFATQVRACLRKSDFVARLSGDEFAIMLEGMRDVEAGVPVVADKLIHAAGAGTVWKGQLLQCLPSIGVAVQKGPAYDAETIMRSADQAMYRSKFGRTTWTAVHCVGEFADADEHVSDGLGE